MEYLIKLVARPHSTILDPFAGSGTTLIAAKKLGCSYLGIEQDAAYCQLARLRITQIPQTH
jgi:site-specific DNA-methyltransferase (adenine-specific)